MSIYYARRHSHTEVSASYKVYQTHEGGRDTYIGLVSEQADGLWRAVAADELTDGYRTRKDAVAQLLLWNARAGVVPNYCTPSNSRIICHRCVTYGRIALATQQ